MGGHILGGRIGIVGVVGLFGNEGALNGLLDPFGQRQFAPRGLALGPLDGGFRNAFNDPSGEIFVGKIGLSQDDVSLSVGVASIARGVGSVNVAGRQGGQMPCTVASAGALGVRKCRRQGR